jgi:Mannosyltransferase (PIG-V)
MTALDRARPWLRGFRLAAALVVGQSLCLAIVGLASPLVGPRAPFAGSWESLIGTDSSLLGRIGSNWQRWDALWYQQISLFGYRAEDHSAAFYPLYPVLTRAVSLPSGELVRAELLVSATATILAAWLLWKLTRFELLTALRREDPARRGPHRSIAAPAISVALVVLFPSGFFLLAPYTEGLFLCLTIGSFWLLRTGRPWAAGVVALLASLTRAQGILLAIPIAYEVLRLAGTLSAIRRRSWQPPGLALLAALLPILGALAFAVFQSQFAASGQIGLDPQAPWGLSLVLPWDALAASAAYIQREFGKPTATIEALNLIALALAFGITVLGIRRVPPVYSLFAVSMLALYPFRMMAFSPLMSVSRYVLVVFPCFIVAGLWLARRPRLAVGWLVVSALIQVALYQYWVRWGFVA